MSNTVTNTTNEDALARQIAETILKGFDRHFLLFKEVTKAAKERYEAADWASEVDARKQRIVLYDKRVREAITTLNTEYDLDKLVPSLWRNIKRWYLWLLYDHNQPELAETFYNSVFCRIFHRAYFDNDYIFVKPGRATEQLDMHEPCYCGHYPDQDGMEKVIEKILHSYGLSLNWVNLKRDVEMLSQQFSELLQTDELPQPNRQIQVLNKLFYRNKAAYIVGRAYVGVELRPFVIPILQNNERRIYCDAFLQEADDIAIVFSFTRAYFMVETTTPAAVVNFLSSILPTKSIADLYTAIGFQKQGKTLFYRDFLHHLEHSSDKLIIAPGIKGMVMSVFTLPSYPYVFKLIKDKFAPPKDVDRATVIAKYHMVKMHDRVGRMADTLEFSHVAFPIERFDKELLDELKKVAASSISIERGKVIISHLYIERRMIPFNIYIDHVDEQKLENAVRGYGDAIKDMIAANIFPGDMLLKNFGITRHGRVVFYDYDEICNLHEVRIRRIPQAKTPEQEYATEPWYHIADEDFFPEQFEHFVINHPKVRALFKKHHNDLLDAAYWQEVQKNIAENHIPTDVFPYAKAHRFTNKYPELFADKKP